MNNNGEFYSLSCISCKTAYDETETVTNCLKCGDPLEITLDFEQVKSRLNMYALKNSPTSALKYLSLYPIKNLEKIISLNEGGTPLNHAKNLGKKLGIANLYIKNEGANPTGVFKDRGTLVEVTKARELGAKGVCLASTGNMAGSVSAYCSVAGIPCYVLVPEGTPVGKLAQTLSYGARVIQVRGTYSDCARLAEEMSQKHDFYLAGDYVFRGEGQKSQGYEIVEQLFWKSPDYVICPVGCGTNLSAIWKGFKEFKELGCMKKLPKLVAVQPDGCNVVVKAFNEGSDEFEILDKPDTVCSAVAAGDPLDGKKILAALKESGGMAVEVTDEDALKMEQMLAKTEAIFTEPSGALSMAAAKKLQEDGVFKDDDVVVCVATGNGLKDPKSALKVLPTPPSVEPDISEIDNYLKYKIYDIQSSAMGNKSKVICHGTCSKDEIKNIIKEEFKIDLDEKFMPAIFAELESFANKGKDVTKADLQNILEERLNEFSLKEKVLDVLDFHVESTKHGKAHATIKLKYFDEELNGESDGDGTVDALITALRSMIKSKDELEIKLLDYNVEIAVGGVNATVKVYMTLRDKNGNQIVSQTSSPDVIVASVNAFEKGYNILYWKNKK